MKTNVLIAKRLIQNINSSHKKFHKKQKLINEPTIAFSISQLWNPHDNEHNWILTAGKIENLRIAAKKLNGLEIEAGKTFSFWKHIGNPTARKGYMVGREIREGCVIPTVAGGLCQLSNALYDAALKANFKIIERYRHTKIIKGSLAEQDRDATVKWNYIDLRFKSSFDFRIEIELTSDNLIVNFKGNKCKEKSIHNTTKTNNRLPNTLNDCYSCGKTTCFKHPEKTFITRKPNKTTFILDEKWPEYDNYIKSIAKDSDNYILPLKKNIFIKSNRYRWPAIKTKSVHYTYFQGIYRALKLRYFLKNTNNVFEVLLKLDKSIAKKAAQKIPFDSTHIIISQNLLPFVYETGYLGGRTFDVLMTRLPFEKLHQRLDFALSKNPTSPTLNDFRASKKLVELESKALNKASNIITPHSEISEIFNHKVIPLNWHLKKCDHNYKPSKYKKQILFPASFVGRKGAYEIRKLTRELNFNLIT